MTLRDKLKKSNCFQPFAIPEWDTGGEQYSLRSLSPNEFIQLREAAKDAPEDGFDGLTKPFALLFGDSAGNRVYGDSEEDFKEIAEKIPLIALKRVVEAGTLFNRDEAKKN